jgi:hypothetical protein
MARMVFILLILSLKSFSFELKNGDVILQPLHCWSCSLIMDQEESKYSHIGIYLKIEGEPFVFEAYGKVRFTPFDKFFKRTHKGKSLKVMRFHKILFNPESILDETIRYDGLPYDTQFLWNNYNEKGEMIYCSELVYKIFAPFGYDLKTKYMSFDVNREYWIKFFRGNPPDGQIGISPEDIHRSSELYTVGEILN